jgi:hypothetical protein
MQTWLNPAAVILAAFALIYAVWTWSEKRNADLVQIGINVLRVDPEEEKQISAAREWALNLIDANAGVKFTPEARKQLLREPLKSLGQSMSLSNEDAEGWVKSNRIHPNSPK